MGTREAGKSCDRMKTPPDGGVIAECQWRTPTILRDIISVQHAAAVRNKVAFFNTFGAMGGADRMDEWFTADPKMAYKDRVHLTDLGYQRWADELSNALFADYARWRRSQKLPPSTALVAPRP
jgi:hypothetical protein